jgi:hypothetical protein
MMRHGQQSALISGRRKHRCVLSLLIELNYIRHLKYSTSIRRPNQTCRKAMQNPIPSISTLKSMQMHPTAVTRLTIAPQSTLV